MSAETPTNPVTLAQPSTSSESLKTEDIMVASSADLILEAPVSQSSVIVVETKRPFMLNFDLDLVPLTPNDPPEKCPKFVKDKHPEWIQGWTDY